MTAVRFESADQAIPEIRRGFFCLISGIVPRAAVDDPGALVFYSAAETRTQAPRAKPRGCEARRAAPETSVTGGALLKRLVRVSFFLPCATSGASSWRSARRASASRWAAARARRSAGAARAPSRRPPPRGRRAPGSSSATRTRGPCAWAARQATARVHRHAQRARADPHALGRPIDRDRHADAEREAVRRDQRQHRLRVLRAELVHARVPHGRPASDGGIHILRLLVVARAHLLHVRVEELRLARRRRLPATRRRAPGARERRGA